MGITNPVIVTRSVTLGLLPRVGESSRVLRRDQRSGPSLRHPRHRGGEGFMLAVRCEIGTHRVGRKWAVVVFRPELCEQTARH